ncbi:nuclear transport factor 2 family protein [Allomuricauda sp. SCSIO 65647]|uniref:nuclear transport factor 2 family protein n=1 Tax=Allomuricauda sp. SCSIO 65647 TaxID=2908843 RepID=UPI001F1BC444|nr:nuclear transport factor 2 family protein [Muricauda sp. SCSIO 65647]UJH68894.1 nuclear transport factor 2 family protein [Muricauda sp. SCSIO 65647]
MKKVNILLILLVGVMINVKAQHKTMEKNSERSFREYQAIENALKSYIESAKTGDASGYAEDWYEHTRVVGSLDGQFYNITRDETMKFAEQLGGSTQVESRIAWIDYQGNAAVVRLESLNWGGVRYTDFFILSKAEGKWKISGKVFDAHDRN